MSEKYSFQRGLFHVLVLRYAHIQDQDQAWSEMIKGMTKSSVMKIVFRGLYKSLVSRRELAALSDQPQEHKQELWITAKQCLPDAEIGEREDFCKSIMGATWLLNNS